MGKPSRAQVRSERRQKIEERRRQAEQEERRRNWGARLRTGLAAGVVLAILAAVVHWAAGEATLLAPAGSVPDFRFSAYQGADLVGGEEVRLSSILAQGKPVILNFYAGQCPPCRAEMPDFERTHQQYREQVLVLGLDIGPFMNLGSREDGRALLRQLGISYPAGTTFDGSVVRAYGIISMPTTVFLTPDGRITRRQSGILSRQQMSQFAQELLQASAAAPS